MIQISLKKSAVDTVFCVDVYNVVYAEYPSAYGRAIAVIFAVVIQIGVIGIPLGAIAIPDSVPIGYKIMAGGVLATIFNAIKQTFTDAERERQIQEIKRKLTEHDEKHAAHDEKHAAHDEKIMQVDQKHDEKHAKLERKFSIEFDSYAEMLKQPWSP
jgi:membrane protein insertase Oxa1/YidC/SpoIIIJ